MSGLESDTIGGFNALLKEQQGVIGEAKVTTVLFDDQYELLHDRVDVMQVAPLSAKDYTVRGSTALLDAIGRTIKRIRTIQKNTAKENRADKVMFVIITDGAENASHKYSAGRIKRRVEKMKNKYGWEFVFIGANMDAITEAGKIGISADRAGNYRADAAGTGMAFQIASAAFTGYRTGKSLSGLFNIKGVRHKNGR